MFEVRFGNPVLRRVATLVCLLAAACLSAALHARASDITTRARVVDVEPVYAEDAEAQRRAAQACLAERPDHSAGLIAALRWDLASSCAAPAGQVSGYRVHYRWDGRTYTVVLKKPPGDYLTIRIRGR